MKKAIIKAILVGYAVFILSLFVPYEFCMGGNGHGLPFAILYPAHGETEWYYYHLEPEVKIHGQQFNFLAVIFNLVAWPIISIVVLFIIKVIKKIRNRAVYSNE